MGVMDLARHLRSWSAADLASLLETRPDLLPATDRGIEAVARKAGTTTSLGRVLVGADVAMLVVAEALVAIEPATIDEIDEFLGTADPLAVIEAVDRLRVRGVAVVDDGIIRPVGALPDLLHRPLGLGPSFSELADHLPTGVLERLAADTRAEGGQRSATIRAVGRRLRDPEVVAALLDGGPDGVETLLAELTQARSPAIPLPPGHPYREPNPDDPLGWLLGRGLVVAVTDRGAELPRELVMAANPEGLAPGAAVRPRLVDGVAGLGQDVVAGRAADRANRTLDGAESLLRLAGRGEISIRRTGGIGPREIGRLTRTTGLDGTEVTRIIELLAVSRLIEVAGGAVAESDVAGRWWALARPRRHLALVRAWISADHFLSRGLPIDPSDDTEPSAGTGPSGPVALGASEPVAATAIARSVAIETMARIEQGQAWHDERLAEAVVWQAPNLWGPGQPPPELLVAWTVAEAELLGLVADGAPAPLLLAVESGDETALAEAATRALADDQSTVVLQGDLTALALGPLAPDVSGPLDQMTDREASADDRAPAFRFTEASIRRAFDAGWTADTVTAFLTEHALAGIPQPLEYLLADVARRHGSVTVMAASTVIITDDDVGAVEIATNKRAGAIGLRLVAPTVLLSPLDPLTVVEGLRAAGFLPVLKGDTIEIGSGTGVSTGRAGSGTGPELPADWTGPPLPLGPLPDEVADAVAFLLEPDQAAPTAAVPTGPTEVELARLWGRPARVMTDGAAAPAEVTGTVVGLGREVSVLTVGGIVEILMTSVRSVERLDGT